MNKEWVEKFDKKFAKNVEITIRKKRYGGSWVFLEKESALLKDVKQFISEQLDKKEKETLEKAIECCGEEDRIVYAMEENDILRDERNTKRQEILNNIKEI